MIKQLATSLEQLLEAISVALILAMTLVIVFGVIMRKSGASLIWYDEVASILLVWITYYGSATAAIKRSHLGFSGLLFGLRGKTQKAVFWFTEIMVIGFFVTIGIYGLIILEYFQGETLVSLPWMSVIVTQSVIPIGSALFVIAELLSIPQALDDMASGRNQDQAELEEYAQECGLSCEGLFADRKSQSGATP
uniref:TRAP transporter small permease n=1 Tax=Marinobacterium profundum TaxID=1714300 RepID=UPI0008348CF2|nr:TRAP transporter small permease subunit [Marinobacterium profundum]